MSEKTEPSVTSWQRLRKPPTIVEGRPDTLPASLQHVQAEVVEMLRRQLHGVIDGSTKVGEWTPTQAQKEFLTDWAQYCIEYGVNCSRTLAAGALHVFRQRQSLDESKAASSETDNEVQKSNRTVLRRTVATLEKTPSIQEAATRIDEFVRASYRKQRETEAQLAAETEPLPEAPERKEETVVDQINIAIRMDNFESAVRIGRTVLEDANADLKTIIAAAVAFQGRGTKVKENSIRTQLSDFERAKSLYERALSMIDPNEFRNTVEKLHKGLDKVIPEITRLKAAVAKLDESIRKKRSP